jgi:cytochrome c oxidase cbb3-type subunit 3
MLTMLQVTTDQAMGSSQSVVQQEAEAVGASLSEETQVASIQEVLPRDYSTGLADRGYDVYNTNCKACHGNLAKGDYGPKLQQNPILHDDNNFWKVVLKGRGNMPAWEERLNSQQIADVQAYLKTLQPPSPF